MKYFFVSALVLCLLYSCQTGSTEVKTAPTSAAGFITALNQLIAADKQSTYSLFQDYEKLEADYVGNGIGMRANETELASILEKRTLIANRQVDWLNTAIQDLYKGEEEDYVDINEKINFLSDKIAELKRGDIKRKGELNDVRTSLNKVYEFVELDKMKVNEMLFELNTEAETLEEKIAYVNSFLEKNPNTLSKKKLSKSRGRLVLEFCSPEKARTEDISLEAYNTMIRDCRKYATWVQDSTQQEKLKANEAMVVEKQGEKIVALCDNFSSDAYFDTPLERSVYMSLGAIAYCDSLRQFLLKEEQSVVMDSIKTERQNELNNIVLDKIKEDQAQASKLDLAALNYKIEENKSLISALSNVELQAEAQKELVGLESKRENKFVSQCEKDKISARKLSLGELNDLALEYESMLTSYFTSAENKKSLRSCIDEIKSLREKLSQREVDIELEKLKVAFSRDIKKSIKRKHEICKVARDFVIVKSSKWTKGKREVDGETIKQTYDLELILVAKSGALCKKTQRYKGRFSAMATLDAQGGVLVTKVGREGLIKL